MSQASPDGPQLGDSSFMTRLVEVFLRGDVAVLVIVLSLVLGAAALWLTPREEEPQIVVPMADVFVAAPGLSAEEVEQQVTRRLEKLLYQIDGVEYVYSMSRPGPVRRHRALLRGRRPRGLAGQALQQDPLEHGLSAARRSVAGWSSRSKSTTCRS